MGAALEGAVELLERSLGYTRVVLTHVGPHNLTAPTPCAGWDLCTRCWAINTLWTSFTKPR